jgi:hypothetical protein
MAVPEESRAPRASQQRKSSVSAPGLASDEDAAVLGELLLSLCFIGIGLPRYSGWRADM